MASLSIHPRFISIGINRTPNAADCSRISGRIAFGAHNTIALWNPADEECRGVEKTLKGHVGLVNVVRWVPSPRGEEVLASGGVDKRVRVWKEDGGVFGLRQTLTDHTGSVNCIAVLDGVLATGSSDGTVNLYSSDPSSHHYTLIQTLQISPLYPLTLALHRTANGDLLAIGGSSPHIHIYTSPLTSPSFTSAAILKGHEDWIRGLDFTSSTPDDKDDPEITLASASQDRYVRLWQISPSSTTSINPNDTDALSLPSHQSVLTCCLTEALGGESYPFTLSNNPYSITFSALLPGHDDWVFTVSFHPINPRILLSASADASLIIWRPESESGIWIPETRLGEVSSLKGATTAQGSSGGFWGGVWAPSGDEVASWGKTGGWRVWTDGGDGVWYQKSAISGAIRGVKGISWDPQGRYLLSTRYDTLDLFAVGLCVSGADDSLDQTTRMYGEWVRDGKRSWHEVARPQIHGYDLNAISSLDDWKFVSGADEKVLRVFQTSRTTAELVNRLASRESNTENLPSTANLPVLGLSNKESTSSSEDPAPTFLSTLSTPPLEDHLSRYTLSPELEKLYAHPSELLAVSSSHNGQFIASTCKSSTPENAVIRVFETTSFSQVAVLFAHSLSVVKLAWSADDGFLVSVGRDRQWTVIDTKSWTVVRSKPKAHARIIWDVDFAPLEMEGIFITASRDKSVKFWGGSNKWDECIATVKFNEAVTACAFLKEVVDGWSYVAIGLENGGMYVLGCKVGGTNWRVVEALGDEATHAEGVTGLEWRSQRGESGKWELASCGDDCSVRIYEVEFSGKDNMNGIS